MVSFYAAHGAAALPMVPTWATYPLLLPNSLMRTLSMNLVLPILAQTAKPPSEMAGIDPNDIAEPTLYVLDRDFREAKLFYDATLLLAERHDSVIRQNIVSTYKVRNYGGWFGWIFSVLECLGGNYKSIEYRDRESSGNRIKWLFQVDFKETARKEKIKSVLKERFQIIEADLKTLSTRNQIDPNLVKQRDQIIQVFKAIFPGETL